MLFQSYLALLTCKSVGYRSSRRERGCVHAPCRCTRTAEEHWPESQEEKGAQYRRRAISTGAHHIFTAVLLADMLLPMTVSMVDLISITAVFSAYVLLLDVVLLIPMSQVDMLLTGHACAQAGASGEAQKEASGRKGVTMFFLCPELPSCPRISLVSVIECANLSWIACGH